MRETWARRIVYFTGIVVLLLSAYFAHIQNPSIVAEKPDTEITHQTKTQLNTDDTRLTTEILARINHGKKIYQQQTCALCHSISGQGNPRYPLDGVGSKHNAEELQSWATGDDRLKDQLSKRTLMLKQRQTSLSNDEIESLIMYLQSIR